MLDVALLVFLGVALALLFDFLNGFHDAANAIATIVTTGVLTPHQAVAMAAFANFVSAFVFSLAVAHTVGSGIVAPGVVTVAIVLSALCGAICWNIITWLLALPTSSSHALIGGLVGAVLVKAGIGALNLGGILTVFLFIFIAPMLGFIGATLFTILIMNIFRWTPPYKVNNLFGRLQIFSSFLYSLGHGSNDAQKTMGIIVALLLSAGFLTEFHIPSWVIFSCYAAIALGTYLGGWRIVKTMGTRITKLHPMEGFCAETAGGVVLLVTAFAGIPVSTTHVIAGSIMGVGAVENARAVRWVTARRIVWAWIITMPAAAIVSSIAYLIISNTIA